MISLGMITFCLQRVAILSLVYNGVVGFLCTIPCLLAGRFPLLSTTRQVSLQLVFSVQLAFHAFFTLTIVTMASFRSRLKKENTVPWPQQMNAILQLGLSKSILIPAKIVPYLGFMADSSREMFHLFPEKKEKFIALIHEILGLAYVSVKTLQRLVGKCVSFAKAVLAAKLFTREMNAVISKGLRSQKLILLRGALREEIAHWLFLENWDDPIPWRDERHIQVSVATDASSSGWGATIIFPNHHQTFDYWSREE